jgi:hypothetical protein
LSFDEAKEKGIYIFQILKWYCFAMPAKKCIIFKKKDSPEIMGGGVDSPMQHGRMVFIPYL